VDILGAPGALGAAGGLLTSPGDVRVEARAILAMNSASYFLKVAPQFGHTSGNTPSVELTLLPQSGQFGSGIATFTGLKHILISDLQE
jgi:hypothetical protein